MEQFYDHNELIALLRALSARVGVSESELLKDIGRRLFGRLVTHFPHFISANSTAFKVLMHVERDIHCEVQDMYPDAELPRFRYHLSAENILELHYQSTRPFADLAQGLIEDCIAHFHEHITVQRENIGSDGTAARFVLTHQ